jgi:hypothetical protein
VAQISQLSYDPYHRQSPAPMTVTSSTPAPPPAAPAPEPTTVSKAFEAMSAAQQAHRAHMAQLQARKDLNAEGYAAQVAAFADSPEAKAVEAHEAAVIARRDQAAADYERTLKGLVPEGDTAQELRNTRAWERHRNAISNAKSPVAAARVAIQNADDAELGVLLQELPAHLGALGVPTDWINQDVEQRAPELAATRAALDKAEQAVTVTRYDAGELRKGFAAGRPPVKLVDPNRFDPDR